MYDVLLVDDEPFAIEGLKLLIDWEKYGFRIQGTCENGEEAIHRIRSDRPDLVVTDIRMPVMDGLRLIEEARKTEDHSPLFVIMSGHDDFDYALRAMRLGVSNYLTKPVADDEAEEMLRSLSARLEEQSKQAAAAREREAQRERRALAFLLFGSEEQRMDALPELGRLSGIAASWIYIRLKTEVKWMPAVRATVLALEENSCCRMVEAGSFSFGVAIGSEENEASEAARRFAETFMQNLPPEAQGHIRLAAGVSVAKPEELIASMETAEEAAKFLFFGEEEIILYRDVKHRELSSDPSVLTLADRIAALTETGSEEEIRAEIQGAFARFEARLMLPELVETFSTRVAVRCASICEELGGDPEEIIRRSPFFGSAANSQDLEGTRRLLEEFCLTFRTEASRLRERSSGGVQAQVAEFLRSHYTESFTIRELAEMFYVHPVYLGQSFTRRYGMGIAEFVHDLRIEEACRLLRSSELSSAAVAERLGYKAYQHFLKQFEKKTGMKPAEFRAQAFG
ncbi:hypothetical protein B9G55_06055 [Saccharibacillus sp. O16]|nr:hypothetical protein B9G55_06055 [Saccharibacillus sp. O16]